ncbi:PREDICTED: ly6/PLAUR domain-containing protein 2-like [Nanorana parkeri]|uniref:ly6/PLAUR domain-containing protein 2-like n=1 Tax=Nanorana parkeri TaxID=125878 RepID=UPI000854508B|nr:PREDICTED: ly6/PLAUR domain-containing protein 2-like [Nanorana parkeri]
MKTMKIPGLIHLTATMALCLQPARCLVCYMCPSPTPSLLCTKTMNCSAPETWCFSTVFGSSGYPFRGNRSVIRGCSDYCHESDINSFGVTQPTSCCQNDLCNINSKGPASMIAGWHTTMIAILSGIFLQIWG